MQGTRTVLIKEIFRLWDEKKKFNKSGRRMNLEPNFLPFYLSIVFYLNVEPIFASLKHLRKFMVLENVGQLLSLKCRDCMDYICQASNHPNIPKHLSSALSSISIPWPGSC